MSPFSRRHRAGLIAIALCLLSSVPARAWRWGDSIEAIIPFEFVVDGRVFGPATYVFDLARSSNSGVLSIKRKDGGEVMMVTTDEMSGKLDPKAANIVFEKHGEKLWLSEVWGLEANGRAVRNTTAAIVPDYDVARPK